MVPALLAAVGTRATLAGSSGPVDGTPLAEAAAAAWLARNGPHPSPLPHRQSPAEIGQAESFFTIDLTTGEFITILAELRGIAATTAVYVEAAQWGTRVDETDVDRVLEAFEQATPPGSVSPGEGISRIIDTRFGPPSDVDGDGRVHILILDIRDWYQGAGSYVSGYYTSHDQTGLFGSNHRDLLYIDSYPANASGNEVLGTVAHEYQHLVHHRQDPDESFFVNEGLSEFASHLCGYGLRSFHPFLVATDVPLDAWSNIEADYSRVSLWTLYLGEQLGEPLITALFRDPANGVAGIENALAAIESPRSFADLLGDWFVANAVNDRQVDSRFGYLATGERASPGTEHTIYPTQVSASVSQLAADFVRFRNVEGLTLRIDGAGVRARVVRREPEGPIGVVNLIPGETLIQPELNDDREEEVLLLPYSDTRFAVSYHYAASAVPGRVREIAYDDGTAEELGVLDPAAGRGFALRFTPEVHRAELRMARIFIDDTTDFMLHVWDDDGPGGMPGSDLLPPLRIRPERGADFYPVNLRDFEVTISAGDFYVGAVGLSGPSFSVGLDGSPAAGGRSLFYDGEVWLPFDQVEDQVGLVGFGLMVRAEVEYDDATPPELLVGLTQNPVFTEQADLYVAGDEPLNGASLHGVMRIAGEPDTLTFAAIESDGRVFVDSSVLLDREGEGEVQVWGTSRYGTRVVVETLRFVVSAVGVAGGQLRLAGAGKVAPAALEIPAGALVSPATVTLQEGAGSSAPGSAGKVVRMLTLGPPGIELRAPARLTITAPNGGMLARWDGGGWEPVVGARAAGDELTGLVTRFGVYAVLSGHGLAPEAVDRLQVVGLTPHPIRDRGTLALDLAANQEVEIRLYDVSGRLRATLFDGWLPAGRQVVPLELEDLPGGQYLIEVAAADLRRHAKVLRLR